jgi:hypothetical protein
MLLSSSSLFFVRRLNVHRCCSSSSIANNSHVRWVGSTTAITKHHPIPGATTVTTMARTTACTRRTRTQRGCLMSTQPLATEEEDVAQIMLILGKPGGGKGTISGKLLKVCFSLFIYTCKLDSIIYQQYAVPQYVVSSLLNFCIY